MTWPTVVSASVSLASGIVVAAGIAVLGLWMRQDSLSPERIPNHLFDYGVWFCLGGFFGNGCWVNP
jgi:hypothetical protein